MRLYLVGLTVIAAMFALVTVNAVPDWKRHLALRNDTATGELGGEASLPLFVGAQAERTRTAAYLADPTPEAKAALAKARAQTDQGIASFEHLSGTELETEHRRKWAYVDRVYAELDDLDDVRQKVDARQGTPDGSTGYYTQLLATMIEFYQQLSAMDDHELTLQTRPLVGLFWASEGLAIEDMLITRARAAGHMTPGNRADFADAYGTQRVMYQRWIAPYLPPAERAEYEDITQSAAWRTKEEVEHALISAPTATGNGALDQLPGQLEKWDAAYAQIAQRIAGLNQTRTQGLISDGYQRADEVRSQVLWQVGSSAAAVLAISVLIGWIIRSVTTGARQLRAGAEQAAQRLPELVERLQAGEEADTRDAFPVPSGRDEFASVGVALASAQEIAVSVASAQAADRRGFARFVTMTSLRASVPVNRQLELLDQLMKRHGEDSALLRELISVDQQGVIIRRFLDHLLILTDHAEEPYSRPRPLADVVNDARAETLDPQRIENKVRIDAAIRPGAVNAVIHVLSALLDNALRYSTHDNPVKITAVQPVHGVAVEIVDMGSGMQPGDYVQLNSRLSEPLSFEAMARGHDGRLGLFVVGHLARKYGLKVRLGPSDYGGTTAVVMLPHNVLDSTAVSVPVRESVTPQGDVAAQGGKALPRRGRTLAHSRSTAAGTPAVSPPRTAGPRASDPGDTDDSHLPLLPRRSPHTHLVPQLSDTHPASRVPEYDPAAAASPETVARRWEALQTGTQAAQTQQGSPDE